MFAHLNPNSCGFGDVCALHAPFLHPLTMHSSLFERGCPVLVVVCVAGLNEEVENLEGDRDIMWGGRRYIFKVFLTGDGKLMLVSNPGE